MVKGNQTFQAAFKKATNSDAKFSEREKRIKDLNHHFVVKFYGLYKERDVEYELFQTRLRYLNKQKLNPCSQVASDGAMCWRFTEVHRE
jgi:hypothetical protein